ncbi:hypothetical protein ACKVMT_00740 [Halobacteriales archaeon Cl-PHB]
MSQRDPLAEESERDAETAPDTDSTFLKGVEFLTGKDPNLGSFLLVVGMVTIAFVALFQLTLPSPVALLLTAGVFVVTGLSGIFGVVLDSLGYFEGEPAAAPGSDEPRTATNPRVPAERSSAPLPPRINFDAELRAYAEMFDGDLPEEFEPFVEDYLRLKANTSDRASVASDLRTELNPIGSLFEDGSEGDRLYEDISGRLFRYIATNGTHLTLDSVTFYDEDGTEMAVRDLENSPGRVTLDVTNEGEAAEVEAVVELYDDDGSVIASRVCKAGLVTPGASTVIDTDIFVPADAEGASTTIQVADTGKTAAGA